MSHEGHEHYELANDLRLTYLANGHKRKSLTSNIPFLQGYQGNACFYCSEPMVPDDIHVDHVLPRQVVPTFAVATPMASAPMASSKGCVAKAGV